MSILQNSPAVSVSNTTQNLCSLAIFHFNDVYNVEDSAVLEETTTQHHITEDELANYSNKTTVCDESGAETLRIGGAARFIRAIDTRRQLYHTTTAMAVQQASAAREATEERKGQSSEKKVDEESGKSAENCAESSCVLFSGDVFSPSTISLKSQGRHLPAVLNRVGVHAAVLGNHDLDFGVDHFEELIKETPRLDWIVSNCVDRTSGHTLAHLKRYTIMQCGESGRVRLGIIGLIEQDWIKTCSTLDEEELHITDCVLAAQELAVQLKQPPHNCHLVIALTHMRWPNDRRLAHEAHQIDLVLGGHDHNYGVEVIQRGTSASASVNDEDDGSNDNSAQEIYLIKSGTDFREFSEITLSVDLERRRIVLLHCERIEVTSDKFQPEPDDLALVARSINAYCTHDKDVELGHVDVDLDGRFQSIRTGETNLGNFVADVILTALEADCAILQAGSFRIDRTIPAGSLYLSDLNQLFPMADPCVVIEMTGPQLLAGLENGVSAWPALEGKFPVVARITFAFSASRPVGSRVDPDSVRVNGEPLDLCPASSKLYTVCVKEYMRRGFDGYDAFRDCRCLQDDEEGVSLNVALQNYFQTVRVLRGLQNLRNRPHRQPLLDRRRARFQRRRSKQFEPVLAEREMASMSFCCDQDAEADGTTTTPKPTSASATEAESRWRERWTRDSDGDGNGVDSLDAINEELTVFDPLKSGGAAGCRGGASSPCTAHQRWELIRDFVLEGEASMCKIKPRIEGRIIRLD